MLSQSRSVLEAAIVGAVFVFIVSLCVGIWKMFNKKPEVQDAKNMRQAVTLEDFSLENETKDCPNCSKTIKLEAKKCHFCGQIFQSEKVEQQIEQVIEEHQRQIEDRKCGIFLENETKKCPMCAEIINLLSKKCELCGEIFDCAEVAKQIEVRRSELRKGLKICPSCSNPGCYFDYTDSYWCPNCKKYFPKLS